MASAGLALDALAGVGRTERGPGSRIPGLLTWAYSVGGVVTLPGKLPTTHP
jgi:hypothetical protein